VKRTDPEKGTSDTVDFDVTTGVYTQLSGTFPIGCIRVGDVKSKMEPAFGVLCVNHILSLGSFVVTGSFLGSQRLSAESHRVTSQDLSLLHQSHRML
jgi:hypothetical protein